MGAGSAGAYARSGPVAVSELLYHTPTGERVERYNMSWETFQDIKRADLAGDRPLQLVDIEFSDGRRVRTFACRVVVFDHEPTVVELTQARVLTLKQELHDIGRAFRLEMLGPYERQCRERIAQAEADLKALPGITKAEILPQFEGLSVKYTTNFAWEG